VTSLLPYAGLFGAKVVCVWLHRVPCWGTLLQAVIDWFVMEPPS
jgi:hypothetical protein